MVLTLKGGSDPQEVVYTAVTAQSAFSGVNLDGLVEGTSVIFCIDKCVPDASGKDDASKSKKK